MFMHIVDLLWFQAAWSFQQIIRCYMYSVAENCVEDFWFTLSCTYLLPYVVRCEYLRDDLINRVNNFFDSLMSSRNAIVWCLAFNVVFNNTPIDLNRKCVNSKTLLEPMKIKGRRDFYALYYTFALTNGIFSSYKEMILVHWLTFYVPIDFILIDCGKRTYDSTLLL